MNGPKHANKNEYRELPEEIVLQKQQTEAIETKATSRELTSCPPICVPHPDESDNTTIPQAGQPSEASGSSMNPKDETNLRRVASKLNAIHLEPN